MRPAQIPPVQVVPSGEATKEGGGGPLAIHVPPSVVEGAISGEKNIHEDWLLVTKNKRANKSKTKSGGINEHEKDNKKVSHEIASRNKFDVLHGIVETASNNTSATKEGESSKGFTFQSDGPKLWTRKKRQRKEPTPVQPKVFSESYYKDILERSRAPTYLRVASTPLEAPAPRDTGKGKSKEAALPHGIRTSMNVKVIAPNHLQFVDEPDPPDPVGKTTLGAVVASSSGMVNERNSMEEDGSPNEDEVIM
ncbi:hypothetical protein SESBI_20526 [Sesbania bispinosa]|nr:hypothetical protein SESBI_20526 [Sesbania bispinosa]